MTNDDISYLDLKPNLHSKLNSQSAFEKNRFRLKYESVLDHKGRINKEVVNVYSGLTSKLKSGTMEISIDEKVKNKLDAAIRDFQFKKLPQGASKSMSPYLLANTFKVDFYDLYRGVEEQKEKAKQEKSIRKMQKALGKAKREQD